MLSLIPLKHFAEAKQRLSGSLSPSERHALVQVMAEDVLSVVLAESAVTRIVLLSDEPAAALLAAHYGVEHWAEAALGARGLNAAVNAAAARVIAEGGEELMVVHADLPLLRSSELRRLLDEHASRERAAAVTVATDRHGRGSNVVLASPPDAIPFAYGTHSCDDHRRAAQVANSDWRVLQLPGAGRDIDDTEDLVALLGVGPEDVVAGRTRAYLQDSGIARRLHAIAGGGANSDTCERDTKP